MAFDTHGASGKPWTGFDLDGTLATYDKWRGISHIGDPVKPMCDLIKKLHGDGKDVKIVTARVAPREDDSHLLARAFIARWCRDNLGFVPPITNEKDALMETLYDDRVHVVEQNTGKVINMTIEFKDMSGKTIRTGDTVEWFGNTYKVKGLSARGMGGTSYDTALLVEIGSGRTFEKPTNELRLANAARSTNSIVAKAMNAVSKKAVNVALPIGDIGVSDSTILWRMIGGGRDEPYHDEYQKRLDKMNQRDIPEDTISILKKYGYKFKNSSAARSRNAVVDKALNARRARNDEQFHTYLVPVLRKGVKDYVTIERVADEETAKKLVDVPSFRIIGVTVDKTRPVKKARNAVGRDKQDAASVELWAGMFENNFLKYVLPKSTDKAKTRKSGESIIKRVEEALGSEGGREQLKRMGWTIQKMRDELEKGLNAATARNAIAGNLPGGTPAARASAELGALADRLVIEADRISDGRHGRRGVSAGVDRISGTVTDMKVHVKIGSAFRELESKARSVLDAIGRKYGAKETDVYNWKGDVELSMKF